MNFDQVKAQLDLLRNLSGGNQGLRLLVKLLVLQKLQELLLLLLLQHSHGLRIELRRTRNSRNSAKVERSHRCPSSSPHIRPFNSRNPITC
jgi:hypothetical protein